MYISARYPTSSQLLNNEDLIFFQSIYIVTKTNYTCKIYLCNICQHYIYLFCNFIVRFCLILNLFLYSLSSLCTIMFYFSSQIKQLELQNCFYVLVYKHNIQVCSINKGSFKKTSQQNSVLVVSLQHHHWPLLYLLFHFISCHRYMSGLTILATHEKAINKVDRCVRRSKPTFQFPKYQAVCVGVPSVREKQHVLGMIMEERKEYREIIDKFKEKRVSHDN